jgi:hypothetical protein
MRVFKRVAVVALLTGLVAAPVAGAASASAATKAPASSSQVWLKGGETSVTTAPGIAKTLIGHGITPSAVKPGTAWVVKGGSAVQFNFPVTGGWVNLSTLHGTIYHKGGILFSAKHAKIEVSNFVISVHMGLLSAEVNGSPKARVNLLNVSLAHASIHKRDRPHPDSARGQRPGRHVPHQLVQGRPGTRHRHHHAALLS